jgi:phosphoglycolate phosphatase-like HAD superfamily hydrolase
LIKAVIFDIDGTLIDSNDAHAESFAKAFEKYGKTVSFEELNRLIGMGAEDILEKYLNKKEIEKFGEELIEYRKNIFLKDYLPDVKVFAKTRELFEKLKTDKIQTALASSAGEDELKEYKKLLNIDDLIEEETNADDAEEAKPEPDIFLTAFEKLKNVEKENILVVGDTPYDAEAAGKAKLKIFGVESGGWTRAKLIEEGCEEVYQDIAEICENYEKIFA